MEVHKVLCMKGGEGENCYANNSSLQKTVISNVKSVLEESIQDLCRTIFSPCLKIADLGCGSGPNTLLVVTEIIHTTYNTCQDWNLSLPGFQFFLVDLPGNDFNSIFRSLPAFHDKLKKEKGDELESCFITGQPGSFYGRLFPCNSLHFVHSSYSLHYLSQVPLGLESETGIPLNKGNIYVSKTSPHTVQQAYWKQFKQDFSHFLKLRSNELIPGGRMLLTLMGRKNDDPFFNENCIPWNLLASALKDMVLEGIVEETKLNSFNMPYYAASTKEIKNLIQAQGSFNLHLLDNFETNWDGTMDDNDAEIIIDKLARGDTIATIIRAVAEPILVSHFGEAIIEDLFSRFKVKATELLLKGEAKHINLVVSLVKKA